MVGGSEDKPKPPKEENHDPHETARLSPSARGWNHPTNERHETGQPPMGSGRNLHLGADDFPRVQVSPRLLLPVYRRARPVRVNAPPNSVLRGQGVGCWGSLLIRQASNIQRPDPFGGRVVPTSPISCFSRSRRWNADPLLSWGFTPGPTHEISLNPLLARLHDRDARLSRRRRANRARGPGRAPGPRPRRSF